MASSASTSLRPWFSLHRQDYKCDTSCLEIPVDDVSFYKTKKDYCGNIEYDFCKVNLEYLKKVNATTECKSQIANLELDEFSSCKNFIYDTSGFYKKTFTSEFDIICENRVLGDWIKSCYYSAFFSVYDIGGGV